MSPTLVNAQGICVAAGQTFVVSPAVPAYRHLSNYSCFAKIHSCYAGLAQLLERVLAKDEAGG